MTRTTGLMVAALILQASHSLQAQNSRPQAVSMANLYSHAATRERVVEGPGGLPLARRWKLRRTKGQSEVVVAFSFRSVRGFYTRLLSKVEGVRMTPRDNALVIEWRQASGAMVRATIEARNNHTVIRSVVQLSAETVHGRAQAPSAIYIIPRNERAVREVMDDIVEERLKRR